MNSSQISSVVKIKTYCFFFFCIAWIKFKVFVWTVWFNAKVIPERWRWSIVLTILLIVSSSGFQV
ncbi:hypothetical protein SMM_0220 [Spiroplasma mirum ATCC 29335]|nr:hypothetical protein SMM_0220 [Spiroplasma mirum ATCC 29335]